TRFSRDWSSDVCSSDLYIDGLNGEVMTQFSLAPLIEEVGQRPYPVSRAELQNMLMDEFGRQDIQLGKKMVSIEDKGQHVEIGFRSEERRVGIECRSRRW